MLGGVGPAGVRDVFAQARAQAPSIIFIGVQPPLRDLPPPGHEWSSVLQYPDVTGSGQGRALLQGRLS